MSVILYTAGNEHLTDLIKSCSENDGSRCYDLKSTDDRTDFHFSETV